MSDSYTAVFLVQKQFASQDSSIWFDAMLGIGNPSWRREKQVDAEANEIRLWTEDVK